MSQQDSAISGLESISRERLPAEDLWAGIEARITARLVPRRARTVWPYALAASLSAALLTAALLRAPQATSEPASVTTASEIVQPSPSNVRPYGNHEIGTLASNRSLRTLRSESRDNAPALVAERAESNGLRKATYSSGERQAHSQQAILRANLKLVSQAEREVRRALKADPESENLKSLLLSAQEKRTQITTLLIHDGE